jgi:predicted aldo/keto reductase-like oxidoreductase
MQYRRFGQLDWQASALGFGAMRLPTLEGDAGKIDEPLATAMVRYAIDHGVNYVDTAYPYHRGTSESFLGRALQEGYRQRVRLVTKMPCWLVKAAEDFDRYLEEQLERLQTPALDFYLLHSLDEEGWHRVRDLGVLDWAERAMAAGRFQHLGFSFHDRYEVFREIIDAYDGWTLCQIQYNYMDEENQAGTAGLQYAAARGLAVVVMEPIRGGQLANPPESIAALWETAARKRSPAEWALQWVWNHPEVSLVLSGMSTMDQVVENVASAGRSGPGTLMEEELALVARARDKYRELAPIPCTDCKYCQPCPNGVAISRIFEVYNEATMYGTLKHAQMLYGWFKPEERADRCLQCGECEEKCPQKIPIMEWLATVQQVLGTERAGEPE